MALLLVLALLLSGTASASPTGLRSCAAALPRGPEVPAPIALRTSCGKYLLERDGDVRRLPARWQAERSEGTGRRYGADLRLRRTPAGAIVVGRGGRVVWRSSGLYPRDAGDSAFGPGRFAFAAYRRGIYMTDLESPERLVLAGVGLHPVAFARDGELVVSTGGWGSSLAVLSRAGELVRSYRYRPRNGYAFDERTETVSFVTPERILARARGSALHLVRPLGGLDGWLSLTGGFLTLSDFAHRGASDEIAFAVLQRDGRLVSRWRWRSPKNARIDYGPHATVDGRTVAFRTVGPRQSVVVYVRLAGEQPRAVFRHRGRQMGCGVGASFSWQGRSLLYAATDGPATILTAQGSTIDLTVVAAKLPRRAPRERADVYWP